jgi:hypothetical protein
MIKNEKHSKLKDGPLKHRLKINVSCQVQFSPRESTPTAQQSNVIPPPLVSVDEFKSKSQYGEEFSSEDIHEEEVPANYKDREKQAEPLKEGVVDI